MSDQPPPLESGAVLDGRYRVESLLGRGGMGAVYLGQHLGIGRSVAIKVLDASWGSELAQRFQREAIASGRLDHPNIVAVTDFGVSEDGRAFLVMEALEGESLRDRIERDGRVPWREAVEIVGDVLRGLRHAHARGVIHRDIKPENIFLALKDGQRTVKLLDFGIAKLVQGPSDGPATVTREGITVGTPAYLAPEQAAGGTITPSSDLYSTSVVLFEMIAGRPLFSEPDLVSTMMAHVGRPPPALREAAPDLDVPAALEALVDHGLRKLPGERIASADEYLTRLDDVLRSAGQLAAGARPLRESRPVAIPTASVEAASVEPIPRRWFAIGGAVIGLAALLAIALAISGHSPPRRRARRVLADASAPLRAVVPEVVPSPSAPPDAATPDLRDLELKAALEDLEAGRTCTDRRKGVAELAKLGDPRAIPALERARYRMYGGVLGLGQKNANYCLKADAEAAVAALRAANPDWTGSDRR